MAENSLNRHELVRGLGLLAAISIIVGNVIGTGVFLKARVMTCNVGSPEAVILVWVAAGILSLAGALTYAELSAMKPQAGGEYIFLRDAYGRVWSFLYGWMQMFIAKTGSQASVAVAFAIFMNDLLGSSLRHTIFETQIFGFDYEITTLQLVAVALLVIITVINCASVSVSGNIATVLTFVKIALVLLVGIGAFLLADGSFANFGMTGEGGTCEGVENAVKYGAAGFTFIGGFSAAMLGALWGYDGWNNLTLVAGEVKNPQRNIPLALIGGTILIILLYVLVHIAYFYVLTPAEVASVSASSSVAKEAAFRFLGAGALVLMTAGLMASSVGTLHTSVLTGARVPYAMARDGLMFESFGKLNSARVPVGALIIQCVWACILALSGSFDTLTDYVIFGSWIFYTLVTASVFVFRIKHPEIERPYKAFGYPVIPVLFILAASGLLINTLWTSPGKSFIGIFLILAGLPVYYYLTSRKRESE
jgi:APA family basic amino acid/polyamine antiporter